jgi:hypothetical protein
MPQEEPARGHTDDSDDSLYAQPSPGASPLNHLFSHNPFASRPFPPPLPTISTMAPTSSRILPEQRIEERTCHLPSHHNSAYWISSICVCSAREQQEPFPRLQTDPMRMSEVKAERQVNVGDLEQHLKTAERNVQRAEAKTEKTL